METVMPDTAPEQTVAPVLRGVIFIRMSGASGTIPAASFEVKTIRLVVPYFAPPGLRLLALIQGLAPLAIHCRPPGLKAFRSTHLGLSRSQTLCHWVQPDLRQLHIDFRYRFVETKRLPARLAGEMRVMSVLTRWCRFRHYPLRIHHETPHPIIAGDAVRDTKFHEPFEYAVYRDAINRVVISEHSGDIQMRVCRPARQQARQHRNARLREALAGGTDGGICDGQMIEVGGLHGQLHLTPGWW